MQNNSYAFVPLDESFSTYNLVLRPGGPGGKTGFSMQVQVRPPPEHSAPTGVAVAGDRKSGWKRQQQLRVVNFDSSGLTPQANDYLTSICKTWPNGVPIEQFAKEFIHALERESEHTEGSEPEKQQKPNNFDFITKVLAELQTIGVEHLVAVDDDFGSLTLRVTDQRARAHDMKVSLSSSHAQRPVTSVSCDLPMTLLDAGSTEQLRIEDVYKKFCSTILSLQPLWNELDEIDAIYPSVLRNNRSSAARRIQLSDNVTFQFELSLNAPREVPTCWFLGQAAASAAPRTKFEGYCQSGWDNARSVTHNIQAALGEFLPAQLNGPDDAEHNLHNDAHKKADDDTEAMISHDECGICFSLELDGEIPTVSCENGKCGRVYHGTCLFEYFQNEGATTAGGGGGGPGNVAFGKCPYCNQSMSVRLNKVD